MIRPSLLVVVAALSAAVAWSQGVLADASLEQLLNTHVTSVSKKEENLARIASAVFVISQEDIRRSGASTIPDLLEMVPGVNVARINASEWAVSIRGFNQPYSNKVLVMIDGRSMYAPSFSGVFWDQVNTPIEDIERIEVIRGPGASVWGANAVNGVINIITKSARNTHGGVASITGSATGDEEGLFRYGGQSSAGDYRAFLSTSRIGAFGLPSGAEGDDSWVRSRAGFRSDSSLSANDSLTVEAGVFADRGGSLRFHGFLGLPGDSPYKVQSDSAGGDLLIRWNHASAGGAETSVQGYYDHFRRNDTGQPQVQTTFDLDLHSHRTVGRHDIVWGAGFRSLTSNLTPGYQSGFVPPIRTDHLYSGFFQDEIRLTDQLWLTLGSKLEHNAYTGVEYEPNARIAWAPGSRQMFWAAASRAIRQPSRVETTVNTDLGSVALAPNLVQSFRLTGNPKFQSERVHDFETGYRAQLAGNLSVDVDAFLSFYRNLSTIEPQTPLIVPGPITRIEVLLIYANQRRATNYGGEFSLHWSVTPRWRISPGYSLLHMNVRLDPQSHDTTSATYDTYAPQHALQVHSAINLSRRLEFDQTVYWMQTLANHQVPSHTRLDARMSWHIRESLEFSLIGQNLLRRHFMEFGDVEELVGTMTPRTILGKLTWAF